MSTATDETPTETADDAEAEAEEAQGDQPEDDETAAKVAQRDGSAELIEKAERANRNYTKRLREIFGADTTLYDCTHCNGLGVTFEPEPAADVPPDLKVAENLEACVHCNAYGFNLTPSKNPDHATAVCTRCSGIGYVVKTTPLPDVTAFVPPTAPPDQPVGGQWVPGRGFIPYGQTEPLPNTAGMV